MELMNRKIRNPRAIPSHPEPVGSRVRDIEVGEGLPDDPDELSEELEGYMDVLLSRVPPPIEAGVLTLQEVADAYFARASEMQYLIQKQERQGNIFRGSKYYKFRTGELRSFLELSKRAAELGSRRLTQARLIHDMQQDVNGLYFDEP